MARRRACEGVIGPSAGPVFPLRWAVHSARLNTVVFVCSVGSILILASWIAVDGVTAAAWIDRAMAAASRTFGGFYALAVLAYLAFVIAVAASPLGAVRLGPPGSRPEFPLLSWAAMLFAAGIGIDLLFFCVAEPVSHYLLPPRGPAATAQTARYALELTFLHWGLSGWGVYTLVGLSLAFFGYRRGQPLAIRSALRPLLGRHTDGVAGHAVDVAAVLATVFGISASLGIGILQLTSGLHHMFGVTSGLWVQALLAVVTVAAAAVSAVLGVNRGIRRLSEFNMLLATLLLVFVLVCGDSGALLTALGANAAGYLAGFPTLSLESLMGRVPGDWLNAWTLFFWAWWIAWGPFVGMFLARISRGRTVRGFVAGTLILPMLFMMAWMSVMGNSAIDLVAAGAEPLGQAALETPGLAIYEFFQRLPWPAVTAVVVSVLALVFFVTSGDSGALVLAGFTWRPGAVAGADAPAWLRVLWAAVIGALTLALLVAGGLASLQSAVVVMGLPFALVLCLMAWGLWRGLREEIARR